MADLETLLDRIYYANRRGYTHKEGEVAYLDGAPLRRPLSMPRTQKLIALVIVAVAIVLGFFFVNSTVLASLRETNEAEQAIEANLERPASIETLPSMAELILLGDDDIRTRMSEWGYAYYDASDPDQPGNLVLYKIPDDMTIEEVAGLYTKGVSTLSAVQASKLLNGSWYFSADRNGGTSMVVRYADFSTGNPEIAVRNALAKSGFDPATLSESGEDDSGNTFSSGVMGVADVLTCSWKISALPLDDMYSISGLPENACYVGIRLTIL